MTSATALQSPAVQAVSHRQMANAIRALAMDGVEKAKSGHPGMPMGMADVATVLFSRYLKFDASNPVWADRDRFILSAGHGSMLIYALGYLTGYAEMTIDEIKNFRQLGSKTPGHPEVHPTIGVETTTGPLGQGIATAVGFALAERMLNARFGDDLVDHRTFVIASDGDLMEGISHEAASLAGHLGLGRLIVYYDDNKISIDGPTSLSFSEDIPARFRAYGWNVASIDGHNPEDIAAATEQALQSAKPTLIACRTVIGQGAPTKAGSKDCHGSPLGAAEIEGARKQMDWKAEPFVIPADILNAWREAGQRGAQMRKTWEARHAKAAQRDAFDAALKGEIPAQAIAALTQLKEKIAAEKPKVATRQSSGSVIEVLMPALDILTGGSADLTPSNNTQVKAYPSVAPGKFAGRYIHYGVREHGMAACMNGLALHGGFIPYSGTFMQFADYCRPAIRLSALMKQRVIYVMTHDSIGLGEDGPTHQPVEHLAALRAIPNLLTFRPCDGIETAECWQIAIENKTGPSLLALSRQGLPTLRGAGAENLSAHGGYVLSEAEGARQVTLIATGSEVALAMDAQKALKETGIQAAVVSMPCMELFARQDAAYQEKTLGAAPRIAIEAALRMGWDRWIGPNGAFIGMTGFGDSAPAELLYKHFGITVNATVAAARKLVR